jgi:hypothetical protein
MAGIYALMQSTGIPKLLPGDLFIQKAGRKTYVPFGTSLAITILVFLVIFKYIK